MTRGPGQAPKAGALGGPTDVTVRSRASAAAGQVRVSLAVPAAVRARYVEAGQYVELMPRREDGRPETGFFALANAPSEGEHLELLVRTDAEVGGEAAALLMALNDGDTVPCSGPMGSGFDRAKLRGRAVRVLATGTAIAPARALIVQLLASREARVLSLDYGVRSPEHVAFAEDLARFTSAGIEVAVHFSSPVGDGIEGVLAHHAMFRRWDAGAAEREVVVAVGQLPMVAEVRERWTALGGHPAHVLHNY